VVHHADYLDARDDHSLCGVLFQNPTAVAPTDRVEAVCPDCEARLVAYHLEWWRARALAVTAELEALRAKHPELVPSLDAEAPHAVTAEVKQDQTAAEPAPQDETTFLARARRELTGLCQQFDGAVPFYRLKNAMQDFSDMLTDDERLILAKEVGSDSSLIRWATIEVESLGLSVSNNRVRENSDMQWQEWLEETPQAPAKTKRRFGRSK